MIQVTKNKVDAFSDNVIVEINKSRKVKNGVIEAEEASSHLNRAIYEAKVISVGPDVEDIEIGDNCIFDKFSGAHINTGKESYIKCLTESQIPVIYEGDMLTKDNLFIRGEQVVVELLHDEKITESGVFTGNIDTSDPREQDMDTGTIIAVSDKLKDVSLEVGDIIAFDPYCGMPFTDEDGKKLKTINEFDIRFRVKK